MEWYFFSAIWNMVNASYTNFLMFRLVQTSMNYCRWSLISSSFRLLYRSMSLIETWAYWSRLRAAPLDGQSYRSSNRIFFSRLIEFNFTNAWLISSLSTLQLRLRTIPRNRSLSFLEKLLSIFISNRYSLAFVKMNGSISVWKSRLATFSMQLSFAVRSNNTVAAG